MSPTSTIPYEVLLEVSNTTPDAVTVQVLRREDGGSQAGPVIFLHKGESISLVLTAGVAYKYAIRQPLRAAELSVKIWSDTQCSLVDVFKSPSTHACTEEGIAVTEGITVTSKSSPLPSPQRQRNSRGLQNGR
ncbi:hypothetical protein PYCCODRAFT_1434503 [Trametes coccinea BRFM310]|uniref:Uncharacterized protein n=1 Tax=Trametes coccinea (strain BRFM310) TaxID=1353009 RepID=A0A1Y2ISJ4_TRAC3|nr:hypothetical protein PYCCODRAFT_1434503 [Trametes coccinea BRFM310]